MPAKANIRLITAALLLGTFSMPSSADWELIGFVEVIPPNPTSVDVVTITIGGWWGSSCIPRDSAISSVGSNIYFDVIWDYPPGIACLTVMTQWARTESIGPLSPDTYTVYARVVSYDFIPETYIQLTEFIVTDYQFVVSTESLTVPEGETATFTVMLMNPLGTVEVTVARESGDPDITVESEASLIFDPCSYSVPQIVTLAAAEDDDYLDGETLIKVSASGYLPLEVLASESDNDTPSVLYVDVDATEGNDGRSWAEAFTNLQDAMSIAAAYPGVEEISVAQGVYTPAGPSGDRNTTFQLINGVTIKGGYAGYGEPDPNAGNVQKYETILSGDLNGNDGPNFTNRGDNSFHVVTGSNTNHTAILDGFTITAGDGSVGGGGMLCYHGDPTIRNCTFSGNRSHYGGGIRCYESSLTITNCIFSGNGSLGGSIDDGGGMCTQGAKIPTLINCIFVDNWTTENGGGLYCGNSQVKLTNCIFRGNSDGGGTDESAQIHGGNPAINYCCIQGWTGTLGGTGNIGNDPLFMNPGVRDYHLSWLSPCVNAGDPNRDYTGQTDMDGNPRVRYGRVDMGAYEVFPLGCDFEPDGDVDLADFATFGANWGLADCNGPADFSGNCLVDMSDLLIFAEHWLVGGGKTIGIELTLDNVWMYQHLPGQTFSNLTANVSSLNDPLSNTSYTYDWEIILPDDVTIPPAIIDGGTGDDPFCTFAAPSCDEPNGLSDSGQPFTVKVTVTSDDYGNTGVAEAQFGIALLGDVNNDTVVNVADRSIINAFWQGSFAGDYTLRDCDLNCDGAINVADRSIANAIWLGVLCQNSVSNACPFR